MTTTRLLLLLLTVWCAAAQAAKPARWAPVRGGAGYYLDQASVTRVDQARLAWTMQSFQQPRSTPEGKPYRSVTALHLYACDARTTTLEAQVFYPEPMGKGEPVENYKYEKYSPEQITPDSPYQPILRRVCKPARSKR